MLSHDPARIRALLRGCEPVEIGGSFPPAQPVVWKRPSRTHIAIAFAAIYLIWGSTYLGIRYAVESIPPLLMMGIRHLTAGTLLYAWVRQRGTPAPSRTHWASAAVAGAILFLGGHGSLAWAELKVPSGLAALLSATLPLWIVLLAHLRGTERNLDGRVIAGLLLGFAGVALLVGPEDLRQSGRADWMSAGAVLMGAFLWSMGTVYTRSVKLPSSAVLSAAMQMMAGGAALLLVGSLTEARELHLAAVSAKSVLALAYLTVFGSIIAFTAFTWLMTTSSAARVSTYAYVNPVVAVLLGWALAQEPVGVRTLAAAGVILAGVALVSTRGKKAQVQVQAPPASELQAEAGD
jgi:drug/metabolite transporter (DMT)-like permease